MAVGFGIIGTGMISKFHARAIADVRGAKLVACYNRTAAKAQAFANEFLTRPERCLRLPMRPEVRCLNLSNAAAVACYEALRQWGG